MLLLLPAFLFGGLFKLLAQSGTEPPLLTRAVLVVSRGLSSPLGWAALGGVAVGVWSARRRLIPWARRLPGVAQVLRMAALTRFARAMELQLQAGEGPLTGLQLAAEASQSPELAERMCAAVVGLRDHGDTLVESLARVEWFPRGFLQMLRAGEESANLDGMMARLAEVYEGELECTLDAFTALLEPLAMLLMGCIVGVIVVATMLPMMQVLQTL
jgi:type IV pilus assembly protein PilC